jgi:putative ABC transport system permease protein
MGSRLSAGRWLDEHDDADAARVVVVDELLARKAWGDGDPLAGRLLLPVFGPQGLTREWHTVVGVVRHARLHDLSREVREQVLFPHAQRFPGAMDVVVRGAGEPAALGTMIRAEVRAMDADLPVHALRPMDEYVTAALAQPRFTLTLAGAFGTIALLLAVVGLYGVVSYAVGQRTREFGIRLALGARPQGILWLVLRQGARLAALGLIIGLAGAGLLGAALAGLLFGVRPGDPLAFAAAPLLLALVALVACWLPARRATRTDPAVTLRHE